MYLWRIAFLCLFKCAILTQNNVAYSQKIMKRAPLNGWNASKALNYLLKNEYDARMRPLFEGPPLVLRTHMYIATIGALNEKDMQFSSTFFLGQIWRDPRLNFQSMYNKRSLTLNGPIMKQIWKPDTYVSNEVNSRIPENQFLLEIQPDGTVIYNQRVSTTATCWMDLREFPMDTQTCSVVLESRSLTTRDLIYEWDISRGSKHDVVVIDPSMQMSHFKLIDHHITRVNVTYTTGSFSQLTVSFKLRREKFYYVVQIYLPTILIVILSWVGFWIPRTSPPARVALGITTVLTLTTLIFGVQSTMPKVSYVKGIDFFLMVSFFFVFGALLEYPGSTFLKLPCQRLNDKGVAYYKKLRNKRKKDDAYQQISQDGKRPLYGGIDLEDQELSKRNTTKGVVDESAEESANENNNPPITAVTDEEEKERKKNTNIVDTYSRLLFPLCYILYNAGYWVVFLSK